MRTTSKLLDSVQQGLLGRTVLSGANSSSVKVIARAGSDRNFVFAVNTQRAPINVKVYVPRLHGGSLQVVGERRSLNVYDGRFMDTFQPLAVHVYAQHP
jgi:hypothetical protein